MAKPKYYPKTIIMNTTRQGQSASGFGNSQAPDPAANIQRLNNQQVVQISDNRGGLNFNAMVFVVNKQDNTVDFNNTGIGQMCTKMRDTQRATFNNS